MRDNEKKCNFCGGTRYERRQVQYFYSHEGKYLLVPNMPVEVCTECGMIYYDAEVLKEVERRFLPSMREESGPIAWLRCRRRP